MALLRVKNWSEFQHYKDRSPPWIKLHKGLLDDYEYQCLPLASKALAPMLWLLASESSDGSIDFNVKKIAFRLRVAERDVVEALSALISAGFLYEELAENEPASSALAECLQDACLETERETEEEREAEERVASAHKSASPPSTLGLRELVAEGVNEQHARDWLKVRKTKKAPLTRTAWDDLNREALKAGISPASAVAICARKSWQGFNATWNWRDDSGPSARPGARAPTAAELRVLQASPGLAAPHLRQAIPMTFDMESDDDAPKRLG